MFIQPEGEANILPSRYTFIRTISLGLEGPLSDRSPRSLILDEQLVNCSMELSFLGSESNDQLQALHILATLE